MVRKRTTWGSEGSKAHSENEGVRAQRRTQKKREVGLENALPEK